MFLVSSSLNLLENFRHSASIPFVGCFIVSTPIMFQIPMMVCLWHIFPVLRVGPVYIVNRTLLHVYILE